MGDERAWTSIGGALSPGWLIRLGLASPPIKQSLLHEFVKDQDFLVEARVLAWLSEPSWLSVPGSIDLILRVRRQHPSESVLTMDHFVDFQGSNSTSPRRAAKIVFRSVGKSFDVKPRDMTGASRRQSLVRARGIAVILLRDLFRFTWQQIAELSGRKDHSTVMHAYAKTSHDLLDDVKLAACLESLKLQLAQELTLLN